MIFWIILLNNSFEYLDGFFLFPHPFAVWNDHEEGNFAPAECFAQ